MPTDLPRGHERHYDRKVRRTFLQLLALSPIPVIVLLILWSGKRPLPPPVKLAKGGSGAKANAADKLLPKKLPSGFLRQAKPELFNKKTLFDRINGAAPTYLKAGFKRSYGVEYKRKGDKDPVTVDLYDMGGPAQALGLYAKESDPSYKFVKVGNGGYLAAGSLNFWFGKYYLKLAGFEEGEAMDKALKALAKDLIKGMGKMPATARVLKTLSFLPAESKKTNTDAYTEPALMGIAGLEQAYFARYTAGEEQYRLFIVLEKDATSSQKRFDKINAHFKGQEGIKIDLPKDKSDDAPRQLIATKEQKASLVMVDKGVLVGALDFPAAKIEDVRKVLISTLSKGVGR